MDKYHPSEAVALDRLEDTFFYLEDGKPVEIARSRAFELRQEGLEAFNEDLKQYLSLSALANAHHAQLLHGWAMQVLQKAAPLYFWVIPSSSTGKYHPPFSQGAQGLVKHTLAGVYYAMEFSRTFGLSDDDTACAIVASAIHDLCKYGLAYDVRYFGVHECLVRVKLGYKETGLDKDLPKALYDKIIGAVETHNGSMKAGEWVAFRSPPQDDISRVVHLADYTVSRKKFVYDI